MQTTQHILMVRPHRFESNYQTQGSNYFQNPTSHRPNLHQLANAQFDAYVEKLRTAGINVLVIQDEPEPHTPDSIFPNNWVSFHADGSVFLYPMEAVNRREERDPRVLQLIRAQFDLRNIYDFSYFESQGKYLEGTGSMVLDRKNRIAYVCHSSRSDRDVMSEFEQKMHYQALWFHAEDAQGRPIYHTNVMMSVGKKLAFLCLDAIRCQSEKALVTNMLTNTGKFIIEISLQQMNAFAGNVLELHNNAGQAILAISQRAWMSLTSQQQQTIKQHVSPVIADLDLIEDLGGGGARCMIAEIHLPLKTQENAS